MKKQYIELYDDYVELWRYKLCADNHFNQDRRIEFRVEPNFDLSKLFEVQNNEWLDNGVDSTYLFCDLNEENAGTFLLPWNVKHEG